MRGVAMGFVWLAVAGCHVVTGGSAGSGSATTPASPGGGEAAAPEGPARSGNWPMPDLTGKTREEAEAALRADGMRGTVIVEDNYLCDDPNVTEQQVCFTKPAKGQPTSATLPIVLYLRMKGSATYDMPDFRGKTPEETRAALMKLGQIEQRLSFQEMDFINDGCQAGRVCEQDPAPGTRTKESDYKTFRVSPAKDPLKD